MLHDDELKLFAFELALEINFVGVDSYEKAEEELG
jgi:hypothetical protein